MQSDAAKTVTQLLGRMSRGDDAAGHELLPLLYAELHALAERSMRGQAAGHTLQPTALVHEAWMRLAGADGASPSAEPAGRAHFLGLAARAMRSVLVDHARRRHSAKRGGAARRLPLDDVADLFSARAPDLLALDEALDGLTATDPQLGRLVELRFFAGLSVEETAAVLSVSEATVVRGWRVARMWLERALGPGANDAPAH